MRDPWFALEVLGHLVGNDQAEDADAVRQLRDRLWGVLEIVALNEPEPDRLSEARTDPTSKSNRNPRIALSGEEVSARLSRRS